MNKHNHRSASDQPVMFKTGGHTWHLLRDDGTDETETPTHVNPLTQETP